jgi:hypothetical protein
MGVTGETLMLTPVPVGTEAPRCNDQLIASAAELADAFPDGVPPELASVDFQHDAIVLGSSNPSIMFAVAHDGSITVGEQRQCQGAAPECTAYVVHTTAAAGLEVVTCPYTGPDPCLAP